MTVLAATILRHDVAPTRGDGTHRVPFMANRTLPAV
jgi:hypothetical protein